MRDYPTRTIADIFVLTGDIGGRGRGQECEGRGNLLFGQAVLQLYPELYLIHRGPFHKIVQMPQRRPIVHWVLQLGTV